jgi:hypothetical protein
MLSQTWRQFPYISLALSVESVPYISLALSVESEGLANSVGCLYVAFSPAHSSSV